MVCLEIQISRVRYIHMPLNGKIAFLYSPLRFLVHKHLIILPCLHFHCTLMKYVPWYCQAKDKTLISCIKLRFISLSTYLSRSPERQSQFFVILLASCLCLSVCLPVCLSCDFTTTISRPTYYMYFTWSSISLPKRSTSLCILNCSCHTTNAEERWETLALSNERNKITKDGATKSLLRSYF
jgi:hypothetical protein